MLANESLILIPVSAAVPFPYRQVFSGVQDQSVFPNPGFSAVRVPNDHVLPRIMETIEFSYLAKKIAKILTDWRRIAEFIRNLGFTKAG